MSDQNPPTNKLQPQTSDKAAEVAGAPSTKRDGEGEKKKLPQLGALEDDDEFEDFPAAAEQSGNVLDSLNKASGGKAEPLWQDNWDDDDVEDDFTKQLRAAVANKNSTPATGGDETMKG